MRFNLTIKFGNDAMQSADDIVRALDQVAAKIDGSAAQVSDGIILDLNGNAVGHWEVTE